MMILEKTESELNQWLETHENKLLHVDDLVTPADVWSNQYVLLLLIVVVYFHMREDVQRDNKRERRYKEKDRQNTNLTLTCVSTTTFTNINEPSSNIHHCHHY